MKKNRKKISMQDIADYLNISKNAVSLALSNKPGVSDELRESIFQAAHKLNYGKLEFGEDTKKINILVAIPQYIANDSFFYSDIYWAIEKEARKNGCSAIISSVSEEMEEKLLLPDILDQIRFQGILSVGVLSNNYMKKFIDTRLPILTLDNYYDELPINSLVTANEEGAYKVVKHLIDNGHRKIGFIGSYMATSSFFERWNGYNKAMLMCGLNVDKSICILESSPLRDLLSNADELESYINLVPEYPTAWFCANDRIAIALIQVLNRKNIKVPDDISVAGFDDIEALNLFNPPLTTLRVERELMGRKAVDFILDNLKKPNEGKIKISLYGNLVIRQSVKSLSKNIASIETAGNYA